MSIKDYIAKGDCLELMETIPDKSIDLVLCDLPYGLTDAHWDTEIPFDDLWSSYKRIVKINGTVILFGIQPFTTKIISSNIKDFQCVWYWKKGTATGHLSAKKMPLRCIEDIVVFRVNRPYSNNKGLHIGLREYFLAEREKCGLKRKEIEKLLGNQMASHYFTMGEQFAIPTKADYTKLQSTGYFQRDYRDVLEEFRGNQSKAIGHPTYNPQGVKKLEIPKRKTEHLNNQGTLYSNIAPKIHIQEYTNYPKNCLEYDKDYKNIIHPTQKPVALLEYLIRTYSNEEEVILDNCIGSGSTCIAAIRTGRHYIGFEKDDACFESAKRWIEAEKSRAQNKET